MSRVEAVLKDYRASLDEVRKGASQATNSLTESSRLDLAEQMILDFIRGLLADLGEGAGSDETSQSMITRASAAVRIHQERFVKDAPLEFLAQQVEGLNQVVRDIGYLRKGFGRGSTKPKPADMKWSHLRAVESCVRDTARRIAGELKTDGAADVQRLKPEVQIDLAAAQRGIVDLLGQKLTPPEFMDAAIELGRRQTQVAGWDAFRDLPYEDELHERSSFFIDVVEGEPPAKPLTGFGVEVAHRSRGGETTADLWLMGGSAYEPNDETWQDVQEYTPRDHEAHSEVLPAISRLSYTLGGLGNAADYTLSLAWAAYFSRACAYRYIQEKQLDRVGLRVGFSGGDCIEFGWLTAQ